MPIDLFADENIDGRLVELLRLNDYHITYIRETVPGARDEAVLAAAHADGTILLTEDKDFGEWVFAHRHPTVGIILLRYRPADKARIWQILLDLLAAQAEALLGKFTVVTVTKTRIRDITL